MSIPGDCLRSDSIPELSEGKARAISRMPILGDVETSLPLLRKSMKNSICVALGEGADTTGELAARGVVLVRDGGLALRLLLLLSADEVFLKFFLSKPARVLLEGAATGELLLLGCF
ncbi:hypothetical protein PR001_g8805 [Phytophthora rubi]|uniref:Uncharacterized protein n=1 Tax=Phytophthora rubi TaxID=129364 RepID=A0A6A3N6C4_9STRA|nr:hypothetical protein PR001_g8805 [Phytophthora rubi]